MTLNAGDAIPDLTLTVAGADGAKSIPSREFFGGKTVVLFALPGAFTPTCSARHLPGYKDQAAALKARGVDVIACTSVNDPYVMKAWAQDQGIGDEVVMLADGNGDFARAMGMAYDASAHGMGAVRSRRYAMIVRDGKIDKLFAEQPGEFKVSAAEYVLEQL